jgi:hypothetical protein
MRVQNIIWQLDWQFEMFTNCKTPVLKHHTFNQSVFAFLCNKTHRRTNLPNVCLSRNSTCFGQFLCPSSGVLHCTFGTGICHTGLMTAVVQDQDGTAYIMFLLDSCVYSACMTYTIAECTVNKLMMMDRGTVRNM